MNGGPISAVVSQIIALLRPSCGQTAIYGDVARRLSRIAEKTPPWGWRYVQSVRAGTVDPSPRFEHAARLLLDELQQGTPALAAVQALIQVHARPGHVTPGAWILSPSRPCAEPGCTVHFVPRVPWQKYCPLHARNH